MSYNQPAIPFSVLNLHYSELVYDDFYRRRYYHSNNLSLKGNKCIHLHKLNPALSLMKVIKILPPPDAISRPLNTTWHYIVTTW